MEYHHIPFIESIPDPEEFDRRPDLLEAQYLEMLDNAGDEIRSALEVLAGPDALPAVFHCTAGKDRTGLLSAILLSLLGVPEETVVADYALSQEAMGRLKEKIIRKYPDSEDMLETSRGSSRPSRPRCTRCSPTCRNSTARWTATWRGSERIPRWWRVAGRRCWSRRPPLSSSAFSSSSLASGRRRSMAEARARSSRVRPPESWVVRVRRTVFHRMSMSG